MSPEDYSKDAFVTITAPPLGGRIVAWEEAAAALACCGSARATMPRAQAAACAGQEIGRNERT